MSLRNEINSALKEAMKEKAQLRLSTLRLITAAIKDRDISARAEGVEEGLTTRNTWNSWENDPSTPGKR